MGIAIKLKVLPESPETDLEKLRNTIEQEINNLGGKLHSYEIEPIAFGLSALILTIAWTEEKELEELEKRLKEIEGVSSVEVLDYRKTL